MGQMTTLAERSAKVRNYLTSDAVASQLGSALPSVGLTPQRFVRAALTAFTLNPKLYDCDMQSVMRCLILSAQSGLAPTGRGGMWLVPFNNRKKGITECTPIIDYRGLLQMARRSGQVSAIDVEVVREGDEFSWAKGTERHLTYKRLAPADATMTHVFACAHLKGDGALPQFEVMDKSQVDAVKARSRANKYGPWVDDYEAMAKKTVIRRLCNLLPMSDDDQRLVELAASEERGIDVGDAMAAMVDIDAEVTDVPDEPESEEPINPDLAKPKPNTGKIPGLD